MTRPRQRHLAFGFGAHTCIGAPLGRRELALTLRTFADRLPNLRLAPGQQTPPLRRSLLNRGIRELHLEWDPIA